mgnify:FL=1
METWMSEEKRLRISDYLESNWNDSSSVIFMLSDTSMSNRPSWISSWPSTRFNQANKSISIPTSLQSAAKVDDLSEILDNSKII